MYYVSIEDTYDVIRRAHIATGHGGRDRMVKEIGKKYVNVTLFWPRLVMVHGKPRHAQSQGFVERANGDIKDM